MDRVGVFLTLVATAVSACAADARAEQFRLIDLTAEGIDEGIEADAWRRDHGGELYPCVTETSARAAIGTVRAGALILSRSRARAQPSSKFFSAADDAVLFDAADFSVGTAAGFDITVLTAISQGLELETRYFGITGWDASRSVADPAGVRFVGFGAEMPLADSERADYASRLHNFEINLRPRVSEGMPLVVGFRTLQLHERFDVWRLDSQGASQDLGAHTRNFLYGLQAGAEPYLFGAGGPLTLEAVIKAGVYANHAMQGTGSPLLGTALEASCNRAAFVGELGLMIDYRFSRFLALRGGYELLWLYGVALAPDQSSVTQLLGNSAGLHSSATAFYQGAAASLEFVF
jgi:hypothetical protein